MILEKKSRVFLASLACFTLGAQLLSATQTLYVNSDTQTATSSCTVPCSTCTDSSNTTCQFLDALAYPPAIPDSGIINLIPSTITYQSGGGNFWLSNETANAVINGASGTGTVINFNGQSSVGSFIFQPTYSDTTNTGSITLSNVVFQNATAGPIDIAGGTLILQGTQTTGGVPFSNNSWAVYLQSGTYQPSLIFDTPFASGVYSAAFPGSLYYRNTGIEFTMTNQSGQAVYITGDITDSGNSGILDVNSTSGNLYFTGSVSVDTVNINNGWNSFSGPNNQISTLNITSSGSGVSFASNVGSATTINLATAMGFGANFNGANGTSAFGTGNTLNLQNANNSIDDTGYQVIVNPLISGVGTYNKYGTGIQSVQNSSNNYTGGTFIHDGTFWIDTIGSINGNVGGLTLNTQDLLAAFYITTNLTLPTGTQVTIGSSGGALSASSGKTLTVDATLAGSGTLQIGNPYVSDTAGTVVLTNTSNTFTGSFVVGATDSLGNERSTTLQVSSASQLGSPASDSTMTLQSNGVFYPTATMTLPMPLVIGSSVGTVYLPSGVTLTVPGASGGAFQISGSGGTLVLNGTNSALRTIAVGSGDTLQISSESNLGLTDYQLGLYGATLATTGNVSTAKSLFISGSNTINVASSTSTTFSGSVSFEGTPALTKTGSGSLSLLPTTAQSNTDFALTVNAGTFTGNTFILEDASIAVNSGASLEFYQTSKGTFNGSITTSSGSGYVSFSGNGPLTFDPSASSYTGGTYINGYVIIDRDSLGSNGAFIAGNGGTLETTASFSMGHPINFQSLTNTTFSTAEDTLLGLYGSVGGSGNLLKEGLGALLLAGNSPSYTGKIYVNEGALIVNGNFSNSSDPIVEAGALLSGTGSVGDTTVYGTLKGGNPLGTLTVAGDLGFEAGSFFGTIFSPTAHSLVNVTGDVTIASDTTYLVGILPGSYTGSGISATVMTGGSITGQFSEILGAATYFFSTSLEYTGTQITLEMTPRSITPLASGQNAINVAHALDDAIHFNRTQVTYTIEPGNVSASPKPELAQVMLSLYPLISNEKAMTYALNQLHPAQLKGMAISQENNAVQVRETISQRIQKELDLRDCCGNNQKIMTAWATGIGESLGQSNENNSWGPLTGYRTNTGGIVSGIDAHFLDHFYAGAIGGYTHSHLHWKKGQGTGDISTGYAGLYASALGKIFYGNISVVGSWSHYSADRHIAYEAIDLTAKNHHGGEQLLSHLDTGLNFDVWGLTIRPFDSFDYISQTENAYKEYNAGQWNLKVSNNNAIMLRNELGVQFSKCYNLFGVKWNVSPKLSWVYEARTKGDDFNVRFADGTYSFEIEGYFPDRSLFAPGIVLGGAALNNLLAFELYYNGAFGSGYSNNDYGGQVRYSF